MLIHIRYGQFWVVKWGGASEHLCAKIAKAELRRGPIFGDIQQDRVVLNVNDLRGVLPSLTMAMLSHQ